MKKITHQGKLKLANITIPCYVTENGIRLLASRRMQEALRLVDQQSSSPTSGNRLVRFLSQKTLNPLFNRIKDRALLTSIKVQYKNRKIVGYDARILSELCDVMLQGRRENLLVGSRQKIIADQCEMLLTGFARVGLIALIDEATGYQEIRDKKALQAILDKYLAKKLAAWAKCFPNEFYKEMFRLRDWNWKGMSINRPQIVGRYTTDIVYDRLIPNIREELERRNPKMEDGKRKHCYHQWFTIDIGHPALAQHLHAVIGLMRASSNWDTFMRLLNRAFPKKGRQLELDIDE